MPSPFHPDGTVIGGLQLEAPINRVLAGTAQRKVDWRSSGTLQAMEAQQPPTPGKRVLRISRTPGGSLRTRNGIAMSESRQSPGAELNILLEGAAIAAWKTFAYHATKSQNVANILTRGLDPNRGGTGASTGSATFQEHSRGHVHYTRKRGLAEDYQHHFQGGCPSAVRTPRLRRLRCSR